jgi:hypothetical protein
MTGSLTRRVLLRRGALAAGLVAAGSGVRVLAQGGQSVPPAAMQRLARGVSLGPGGDGDQQRYVANRSRFAETATPWVKLWADWPRLQPDSSRPPDFSALDSDVAAARADGLKVMITVWRFAPWANGGAAAGPAGQDPTFRLPDDLSPSSAWGRWLDTVVARYAGKADAIEIVNEPNLQLWPQSGAVVAVAQMMETAAAVAARHAGAPMMVAPATADVADDSPQHTSFDAFTRELLARLAQDGFDPGPRFAWSHHNYGDVENGLAGAESSVARVRAMLSGRWTGAPGILVTESGARLDKIAARFGLHDPSAIRLKQAELIESALRRLAYGPDGAGVDLVCHYLFVTDPNYDSGLCDLDGTPRPAYYAWSQLPSLT